MRFQILGGLSDARCCGRLMRWFSAGGGEMSGSSALKQDLEMQEPMIDGVEINLSSAAGAGGAATPGDLPPLTATGRGAGIISPTAASAGGGVRSRSAGGRRPVSPAAENARESYLSDPNDMICGLPRSRAIRWALGVVGLIVLIILLSVVVSVSLRDTSPPPTNASASDIAKCVAARSVWPTLKTTPTARNLQQTGSLLIQHATLWDGAIDSSVVSDVDVQITNGKITAISNSGVRSPLTTPSLDAGGRIITPGIVDAHNHAGVYAWPEVWATQVCVELLPCSVYNSVESADSFSSLPLNTRYMIGRKRRDVPRHSVCASCGWFGSRGLGDADNQSSGCNDGSDPARFCQRVWR